MSQIHTSLARYLLLALMSGCLIISTAAHAQAAEEGGLGGFFQRLFSPQPAPAAQPIPAPAVQVPAYGAGGRCLWGWWPLWTPPGALCAPSPAAGPVRAGQV